MTPSESDCSSQSVPTNIMKLLVSIEIDDVVEKNVEILLKSIRNTILQEFRPMSLKVRNVGQDTTWCSNWKSRKNKILTDSRNDVYWVFAGSTFDDTDTGVLVKY